MTPQSRRPIPQAAVRFVLPLLVLALCTAGLRTHAAETAGVSVTGCQLLSEQQVLDMLGVTPGQPVDADALRAAVRRWNASELYGELRFPADVAEDGPIRLVLAERVRLTGITFSGNEKLSSDTLLATVGLAPQDSVSRAEIDGFAGLIADTYGSEGFPMATVTGEMAELSAESRRLVFRINEGSRAWVSGIEFEGNDSIEAKALAKVMASRKRFWIKWIRPAWFDEGAFREDIGRVEIAYRLRGYRDAVVEGAPFYDRESGGVTLKITVVEGRLYTLKSVEFEGNRIFRSDELADALPVSVGGPCGLDALPTSLQAVAELYAEQGHWDVRPGTASLQGADPEDDEDATVSLKFRIVEGEPVYVRRIIIEGLTKTKEVVIRRNVTFYPGERARLSAFRETERQVRNTGYLDPQSRDPVRVALAPGEGALRDAVVRVEEGPTGRLMLGGGVGSETGFIGQVSIVEDNFDLLNLPSSWDDVWRGNAFRGGGQRLSLNLSAGSERSYYSLVLEDPAVMDSDKSIVGRLYSRIIAHDEYDETRAGASVTLGVRPVRSVHRRITFGYEDVDVDELDSGAPVQIAVDKGNHSRPFARAGVSVDRRDSPFVPTEGHAYGVDLEVTAGDVDTVRVVAHGEKYWTVRQEEGRHKHVVGVRGQLGMVDAYSGHVPVFDRFFAGGFSTLRGFEYEGVSPVDPATREQIGGEGRLLVSVEYSKPISEDDRWRLVTFCDGGWVSEDAEDVFTDIDELRMAVGVGLRAQLGILGPSTVEIDLAVPILDESDDDTQNLHFSFGASRRF